jgi:hypothetical protein
MIFRDPLQGRLVYDAFGRAVPAPQIAVVLALIQYVAFFASAAAEELGWSG